MTARTRPFSLPPGDSRTPLNVRGRYLPDTDGRPYMNSALPGLVVEWWEWDDFDPADLGTRNEDVISTPVEVLRELGPPSVV